MPKDTDRSCISCGYGDDLEILQVWLDKDNEGHWIHPLCAEFHGKLVS